MSWMCCEVVELTIQPEHVHMVSWILPKHSVSEVMGEVKGQMSIRVFKQFPWLRQKPRWGNHFWAQGYCVDTVGIDEARIRLYARWQEERERREEAAVGTYGRAILTCKV